MPTRVMNKGGEIYSGDEKFLVGKKVVFEDVKNVCCSDESSSSSIGKNSDISEEKLSGDGEEVQSSFKGPLDAMDALEEVLPIRRGISRFYNGKSKSFASLADASSSSSIKDIAKPNNAYMRKRRNLLACNLIWDNKARSSPLRSNGGGILKRVTTSSSRTNLALAVAMNNPETEKQALSVSSSRKDFSSLRSFSLADLQQCVSVGVTCSNLNELAAKTS
ncbi:hypothetical protein DH2020_046626 [Rehmannia glutinosa]|uniref:Uncharacterized protein n=1 Tax=Rehmannia glutinosa TaxID=99300 RepID=A0ABR0UAP3_REHGL